MAHHEASPSLATPPHKTTGKPFQRSSVRIAGTYLIVSLLWIGLSDLKLAETGGLTATGFRVSAGKGAVFVLLSTGLVFWLCRREYRNTLKSMTLLSAVVEGTSDAVFVKDRDGKYQLLNTAGAQFIGKPVSEVLGRDDSELFDRADGERLMANDRQVMAQGGAVTLEETLTSLGLTRTYQATKAPYYDASGSIAGLIGISRDVTDRAQVESALRETEARLREAQRIARLGSWSWDPPTNRVWWSDAEFELFGLSATSIKPSFEAFLALLHPDDRPIALARVDAMFAGANEFANDLRIILADGTLMWIHSQARATRSADGTLLSVQGTDQDITASRLAREAAEESERRLQAAIEVAQLGILSINYANETVTFTPRAAEQFGFPIGATVSRSELHSRFHPDDKDNLARLIDGSLDACGSGSFGIEHRVIRPDGSVRWLNVRKQVTFVNEQPSGSVVVTADVTDRREAEARFREQEMLVREAAELAKVGGWGFDPITLQADWTPEVAYMYGLNPDAPPAMQEALSFFSQEQRPQLEDALAAAVQHGTPHDLELQLTGADGEKRWVRTICRPIVEDGRVVRVRGSLQDITDRKRVESELRASEERYRMLFDSNPHPMWVYDVDTLRFLAVNDAAVAKYGYTREEFLTMTIRAIRPDEDVPKLEAGIARDFRGLRRSADWRHRCKDGTVFDVDVSSHDLPDGQGRTRLVLALDITDRKRAEAELQASERRLRLALEAAGAIAFVWDIPSDIVTRYFSKEPALPANSEQVGRLDEVRMRVHPKDLDAFDARLAACLASGTEYRNEYRVIRPDGSTASLEEYGYLDRNEDGSPIQLTGMSIDVTDRLAAVESLRISEERLRVALNGAQGGVWDWDINTGEAWWSPEMYDLFGVPKGMDTREMAVMELIHEEDRARVRDTIANAIAKHTDYHCEFRVLSGKRWLSSQARLSVDTSGTPNRLVGITWDITERVEANEALRLSESRYRQLVDMLPSAIFVQAQDTILFVNPAFMQLMGASNAEELLGRSLFDVLHPASHDLLRRRHDEMLNNPNPLTGFEIVGLRRDGRSIPLHVVAAPIEGYGVNATLFALSDLTERERSAALLRSVLDSVDDAILTVDDQGIVTSVNQSTERLFQYGESEVLGMAVSVLVPDLGVDAHERFGGHDVRSRVTRSAGVGRDVKGLRKDGTSFPAELTVTEFLRDGQREFTWVLRDITARRQLEEQFRQSQKMEAVGRLAGGVAHDFNNLLTVINGYSELILTDLAVDHPLQRPLAAIHDAGDRAARLTKQLLAMSRKSMVEPRLVDLNELVAESAELFRRLIGEDISLSVLADPKPVRVVLDPGQLEQVLMNLVVNARDAMPSGGQLTIETRTVDLSSEPEHASSNLPLGRYAMLRVTDTGCGMSLEVQDKIFEPFFTTKGVGKGTGLGLAVVHGVVQQSGGTIAVDSTHGNGSTFKILLPAADEAVGESTASEINVSLKGRETVLVAEDEEAVRTLVRFALEGQGYTVLTASAGLDALDLLRTHTGQVDLLVTDMIMPGISGRELAEKARRARPNLRVIYMSGYTDDALVRYGLHGTSEQFIQKPFTPLGLVRKVRSILDPIS